MLQKFVPKCKVWENLGRLFASQDDGALQFSKAIWGGDQRIGAIDPEQEPFNELAHESAEAFDLTRLNGSAHDRAFENITTVMLIIKDRVGEFGEPR